MISKLVNFIRIMEIKKKNIIMANIVYDFVCDTQISINIRVNINIIICTSSNDPIRELVHRS